MQIFEFGDYKFVAQSFSNSRNWGHRATMFYKDCELQNAKIIYYNRTWERYTYESVLAKCVNQEIEYQTQYAFDDYRDEHNKKRLTKDEKAKIIENRKIIQELKQLLEKVQNYR